MQETIIKEFIAARGVHLKETNLLQRDVSSGLLLYSIVARMGGECREGDHLPHTAAMGLAAVASRCG